MNAAVVFLRDAPCAGRPRRHDVVSCVRFDKLFPNLFIVTVVVSELRRKVAEDGHTCQCPNTVRDEALLALKIVSFNFGPGLLK